MNKWTQLLTAQEFKRVIQKKKKKKKKNGSPQHDTRPVIHENIHKIISHSGARQARFSAVRKFFIRRFSSSSLFLSRATMNFPGDEQIDPVRKLFIVSLRNEVARSRPDTERAQCLFSIYM